MATSQKPAVVAGIAASPEGDARWQTGNTIIVLGHLGLALGLVEEGQSGTQTTFQGWFGNENGNGQEPTALLEEPVAEVELAVLGVLEEIPIDRRRGLNRQEERQH